MKKIVLIISVLIPIIGSSQKKFGAIAGLNNSSISEGFLSEIYITDKFGFHVGALYEIELSENVIFRPKLVYSQQGNRDNYRNFRTEKLNYLSIPLDLKFFDTTYILFGPQIGFLVFDNNATFSVDSKSTFDAGLKLGLGQRVNNFFIELNFYQGLTKAVENIDFNRGTNTVIQLSAGLFIF